MTAKRKARPACQCRFSDAWRCAKDRQLTQQIACHCECHNYIHADRREHGGTRR